MGYPFTDYIRKFVTGKTVKYIDQDAAGSIWLTFTDGEKLRIYHNPFAKSVDLSMICNPYKANGEVKQSTEITRAAAQTVMDSLPKSSVPDLERLTIA
jgi:hypothetical protein